MTAADGQSPEDQDRKIVRIHLDQSDAPRLSPEAEHERSIAIYDLIEENHFQLVEHLGPYHLVLRSDARHVHFDIRNVEDIPLAGFFRLGPLRQLSAITNWFAKAITNDPRQNTISNSSH